MEIHNNPRALRVVRGVLERDAPAALRVHKGPGLRLRTLRVTYGAGESVLAPLWAGEGFPADVRQALQSLDALDIDPRETPVMVARRMSPGARALLGEAGISWADERGEASIIAPPGLHVSRVRAQPAAAPAAGEEMAWAPGSAAVAEAVLEGPALMRTGDGPVELPAVTLLAEMLRVSPPLVSRALQRFDARGWTEKVGPARGSGAARLLTDPTGLLSSWAAWQSQRATSGLVRAHALVADPDTFVRDVVTPAWSAYDWAVTGWVALERRAPFVTSVPTVDVYVADAVLEDPTTRERALAEAGLREVESGARVLIRPADRYLVALLSSSTTPNEVSDIRLYSDLLASGVRGPESAEHLRETRIGF